MLDYIVNLQDQSLSVHYPEPNAFLNAIHGTSADGRMAIVRTWLSEGIPFAFLGRPIEYEFIRRSVSLALSIEPRAVSLTGSARIGYSLAPQKYGTAFRDNSDLDLFAVDGSLFGSLRTDAENWLKDYANGSVTPAAGERRYWQSNRGQVPKNICKGFITVNLVPNRPAYSCARKVKDTMYRLKRDFAKAFGAQCRRVSLRVYKDWPSAERQISLNIASIPKPGPGATVP